MIGPIVRSCRDDPGELLSTKLANIKVNKKRNPITKPERKFVVKPTNLFFIRLILLFRNSPAKFTKLLIASQVLYVMF